ncbi:WAT1-related protein At1g43650-like [Andrographis paniculata]|uniref:WAT1-related protein At1g43650-like n=1 Tax=Andrographis paniculata TaxID=175694 RepID=UPI0021E7687E|nr:WAT1-related protein At1g43650-like [Andrographis paniculata]
MAAGMRGCVRNMERSKPHFAMILVEALIAGMYLFTKASISEGMNPYVFLFYRQACAALVLAPFAFYLERNQRLPPLSPLLLCKIFVVSTGTTVSLNVSYIGLNFVSATFLAALGNTVPVITFVIAVCLRMERLNIRQRHGMVKVIGSVLGLSGALLSTFARGPAMYPESQKNIFHLPKQTYTRDGWIKGSLIIIAANVVWCLWLAAQGPLIKQYPAKLRLTALQCLFSSVTSAVWAVAMERNPESWKFGWNLNLFTVLYSGVLMAGFGYWLIAWVVEKKGPLFTAVYMPLSLVIAAIFSAIFFQETIHWGSFCGMIVLVMGLYAILWAKSVEEKPEAIEDQVEKKEGSEGKMIVDDIACRDDNRVYV